MYRTCIFCSADLGGNDALEAFPVGRSVAFDEWKGRLWAVCRRCRRWNLAPIEERWEAVEAAEKLFVDSRLRAQSENVGLAKLPDGTKLIRVGRALPGEMAAWRYGVQLLARRRNHLIAGGAVAAVALAVGGLAVAAGIGGGLGLLNLGNIAVRYRTSRRVVHRMSAAEAPAGAELIVRRHHLNGAMLTASSTGDGIAIHLPAGQDPVRRKLGNGRYGWISDPLLIEGSPARAVISRAMVDANAKGASSRNLDRAITLIDLAGGANAYLGQTASQELSLGMPPVMNPAKKVTWKMFAASFRGDQLPVANVHLRRSLRKTRPAAPELLALEMALHEESERRALDGELAELEAAWREAEEIAAIADVLPDDPTESG